MAKKIKNKLQKTTITGEEKKKKKGEMRGDYMNAYQLSNRIE